ncbi:hypothetical protein BGZ83_000210, partial [Gryganskiella cystojenkinii]
LPEIYKMLAVARNRAILGVIVLLVVVGLILPVMFLELEWSLKDLGSFSSQRPFSRLHFTDNQGKRHRGAMLNQVTASGTKYTAFVHKSCAETFTFGYSWFTTAFNIVCDSEDPSRLCNLWIENSNGYETLGQKSLNLWKLVHAMDSAEEIVIKIDDDTLIQKHVLDEFIDNFARKKECKVAGMINRWGDEFHWPLGRLYLFKKWALPATGDARWEEAMRFERWEDAQIGFLVGATEVPMVCDLGPDQAEKFFHADLVEPRVEIHFKALSAKCGKD